MNLVVVVVMIEVVGKWWSIEEAWTHQSDVPAWYLGIYRQECHRLFSRRCASNCAIQSILSFLLPLSLSIVNSQRHLFLSGCFSLSSLLTTPHNAPPLHTSDPRIEPPPSPRPTNHPPPNISTLPIHKTHILRTDYSIIESTMAIRP